MVAATLIRQHAAVGAAQVQQSAQRPALLEGHTGEHFVVINLRQAGQPSSQTIQAIVILRSVSKEELQLSLHSSLAVGPIGISAHHSQSKAGP